MNLPRPHRSYSFFLALALVLLPGLAVAGVLGANQLGYCVNAILPGGDGLNARPYLVQVEPELATLRFRSTDATEATVTWVEQNGPSNTTVVPAAKLQTVELPNLRPGLTYSYTVERGEHIWEGAFRTPIGVSDTVHFDVIGSSGAASEAQHAIAAEKKLDDPDFILHTGDVVFPRGALCHYGLRYFGPYEDLVGDSPVAPAPGEIDLKAADGRAFREIFLLTDESTTRPPLYRSFDYGPAHIVVLDSERYERDDKTGIETQRAWLQADLQATALPWTIVVIHRPLYSSTSGAANDRIAADLGPIFADAGVDLVLSGHARNYERFQPGDGITYVVTGGGGAGLQTLGTKRSSVAAASAHHFLSIEVSPEQLAVRVIDDTGAVIDAFSLPGSTSVSSVQSTEY